MENNNSQQMKNDGLHLTKEQFDAGVGLQGNLSPEVNRELGRGNGYAIGDGTGIHFDDKSLQDYLNEGQKRKVVAVKMSGSEIDLLKLDDGSIVSKRRAFDLANNGILAGYITAESKTGEPYIRTAGDGVESNNLQQLPRF